MKKILLLLLTCVALKSSASAAEITFTFRATANATGEGYTSGATYNFSFTTGASYPTLSTLSQSTFNANSSVSNYWKNFDTSDSALFASASGNGLAGTFVPSATNPGSYIFLNGLSGGSDFQIGSSANQTAGMTTLNGTTLSRFWAGGVQLTLSPSGGFNGSYVDPTTYFAGSPGVYSVTSSALTLYGLTNNPLANFTLNQLTISGASAIPEPSTYAAIAGAAMLGLAVWQRRRRTTPDAA